MSVGDPEALVARFLDEREAEPDLSPEAFAAAHPEGGAGLLAAIRSTLEVAGILESARASMPESVGPYRVVREIGRGGMGVVFEVEGENGSRLALKILPSASLLGAKALDRFRREAAVLRSLSHEGIVAVRDVGTHAGAPYLVMDLVPGTSLSTLPGRLDPAQAASIVRQLAQALAFAHSRGVLHRDLKPQNVIVRPDGRAVLIDFGLVAREGEESLTSTGAILGTPRYMPPEQALGREVDARSDVYAVGAILYELLVGRPAHDQESRARVLEAVIAGHFVRPRSASPEVPRDLERIVLQCLAWDPERRYPGPEALAQDLDRFLDGTPVHARPPGMVSTILRRVRANPSRAMVSAALLLLAGIGILWSAQTWAGGRIQSRTQFEAHRDHAVAAWALGNPARARREASQAVRIRPEDAECAALLRRIESEDAGSPPDADARHGAEIEGTRLGAILAARTLSAAGRREEAAALLAERAGREPRSSALRAELAAVLDGLGRQGEAVRACDEAIGLDPGNPELHERRSALLFSLGQIETAVDAAHTASGLAFAGGDSSPARLVGILRRASDPEAVRAVLREQLERDPDRTDTRFALAASYDTDHRLREARGEYERVLERDPRHAHATLYLANLRLGADRTRCRSCDESYARAPEVLDREEGTRLLVRAIDLDRGRDEALLRTITAIGVVQGVLDPVAESLAGLLANEPAGPVATRIEASLQRMRQAGARR